MSSIRPLMIRVSHRVNHALGARFGDSFPFTYVSEYPKSGGTWLSLMVGDVLQAIVPQLSIFPAGCAAVLHNHWRYDHRLRRVIYLSRDGRDVLVSSFFHMLRDYQSKASPSHHHATKRLNRLFGANFDAQNTRELLPRFIEGIFERPLGNRLNWADHVGEWHDPENRKHIAYVRYEQLLEDPHAHLKRVVERATGKPIEQWRIDMAVEKFSIQRQTGRTSGQEDRSHFIRKGVAGDWKNHFTTESAKAFHERAGEVLIRLGYEPDASWVERIGDQAAAPADTSTSTQDDASIRASQ